MKKILTIMLIDISLGSCGQSYSDINVSIEKEEIPKKYLAKRDSIIKETDYGSIYVTTDTSAVMFSWLANESIDTSIFNELYSTENIKEFLNTNKIKMKKFKNIAVSGNWSSLYILNDKFYVYSPSDWLFNERILISDSALYHFGSADWRIESIQNVETNSNGDIKINLSGFRGEKIELSIRFIDDNKNIALWHRKSSEGYENSELRVRSSEVRKFDMIVNDCLGTKCFQEFIFETPEYSEIIKTYGKTSLAKKQKSSLTKTIN
jgi:hypothetical protein